MRFKLFFLSMFIISACTSHYPDPQMLKAEIEAVEAAFNASVAENGIHQGFLEFAADDAVLIRNAQATEGKSAIAAGFSQRPDTGQKLTWIPRKIEVTASGELAYSFCDFMYLATDSLNQIDTSTGNFCTIWKKQADGSWKFVVD